MTNATADAKDKRVEIAIHNWAPRFVSAGVPLADFNEVTGAITEWDDWCAVWSERASIHDMRVKGQQQRKEIERYNKETERENKERRRLHIAKGE